MAKLGGSDKPQTLPTEAELEILQILWVQGPKTVREVHAALHKKQIGYTTVLKQMQLMAEKGLLTRNERYRSHVYSPGMPRERIQHGLLTNLVQRAFSGSAKNLVLGALSARPISKTELAEIKQIIEQYEEEP